MVYDFTSVTEMTGNNVTQDQLNRLLTRYSFALENFDAGAVLEIACGSGQGLGYMTKKANKVVGIDIDSMLVALGIRHYASRSDIEVIEGNAEELPFPDNVFNQVILFECIYYFENPIKVIKEAHRVLRPKGNLVYCSANPEWDAFNPSPFSNRYFSGREIHKLLIDIFPKVFIYASSPTKAITFKDKIVNLAKKIAIKLKIIPSSMKGKELLKKLFMGSLTPLPNEINDEHGNPFPVHPIDCSQKIEGYKVIFAKAVKG